MLFLHLLGISCLMASAKCQHQCWGFTMSFSLSPWLQMPFSSVRDVLASSPTLLVGLQASTHPPGGHRHSRPESSAQSMDHNFPPLLGSPILYDLSLLPEPARAPSRRPLCPAVTSLQPQQTIFRGSDLPGRVLPPGLCPWGAPLPPHRLGSSMPLGRGPSLTLQTSAQSPP